MVSCENILRLYQNVLHSDIELYNIPNEAVRIGIESMAHVYKPETVNLNSDRAIVADYNDPAHRCAYLHKYAAFHTAMVRDIIAEAIEADYDYFRNFLYSQDIFRICSLGGGPGSDVIGALAAFHNNFSFFNAASTVVDYMFEWNKSFHSIMKELSFGSYGSFGAQLSCMPWRYYRANLLKRLTPEVNEALGTASLVTMVKFASAAACQDTEQMMMNIFTAMRPGAVVLFIDNSGGGFHNIVQKAATACNFFSIYGPIMHKNYTNTSTKLTRFGRSSCCKTTVAVHMLQKPRYVFPAHFPLYSPSIVNPTFDHPIMVPPHAPSPLTPMLFRSDQDFTQDEYLTSCPEFVSPDLPLSPYPDNVAVRSCIATPLHANIINTPMQSRRRAILSTPGSQSRQKKNRKNGCLPLNRFRHHLKEKMNKFKTHAKSFQKKIKQKAHPIFNL